MIRKFYSAAPLLIGTSCICVFGARVFATTEFTSNINMAQNVNSTTSSYESGSNSAVFVTTPDQASAKRLAHSIVSQKLAACVNIIPQITSIYDWEGKINEDTEVLMMIKTRTSRIDDLAKFVRENHPYSIAEVISLPIENGNWPYLDWISKTVPDKN